MRTTGQLNATQKQRSALTTNMQSNQNADLRSETLHVHGYVKLGSSAVGRNSIQLVVQSGADRIQRPAMTWLELVTGTTLPACVCFG